MVSQWLRVAGGPTLTASSCRMCSMVASSARVPLVASSSTALTVFKSDVTLVTITCRQPAKELLKDQPAISCVSCVVPHLFSPQAGGLRWAHPQPPPCSALTFAEFFSWYTAGSSPDLPAAALVALIRSPRALATSLTALIRTTWAQRRAG